MSNVLYILKKRDTMQEAQTASEQEYIAFSAAFSQLKTKVERVELHELYQPEGKVAYLIRVNIQAGEETFHAIRAWANEHIVCDVPVTWDALNAPLSVLPNQ